MSSLSARGGRGRGRGGFRPKRRLISEDLPAAIENISKIKAEPAAPALPPSENSSSAPQPPRKPFNVFNLPKQATVTEMDTNKLYEKLKCTPPSQNSDKKKNDDEDEDDDDRRCEFCAKDHPTRFCTIFNVNKSSVQPTPLNACYYCKQTGHYKQSCPKKMVRDRANTSGSNAEIGTNRRTNFRDQSKNFGGNRSNAASSNTGGGGPGGTDSQKMGTDWPIIQNNLRSTGRQGGPPQKKIVVPMPVPASSIKPVVQLRSKLKANAVSEVPVATKSISKDMYCRSDTDDFSSSESDEIDGNSSVPSSSAIGGANLGENSSKKSESHTRQPPPVKAKFDLSSIDLVDSSDKKLAASFKSHHTPPSLLAVQRSGQKRLNLSEILYPQKSPSEPAKPSKVEVSVANDSTNNKPADVSTNGQAVNNDIKTEEMVTETLVAVKNQSTKDIESAMKNVVLSPEKVQPSLPEPVESSLPEQLDSSLSEQAESPLPVQIESIEEKDESSTLITKLEKIDASVEKDVEEEKKSELDEEDEFENADVKYSVDFDSDSAAFDDKSEAEIGDGAFLDEDDSELDREVIADIIDENDMDEEENLDVNAMLDQEKEPCCSSSIFKPKPFVKPPTLILQPVESDADENAEKE